MSKYTAEQVRDWLRHEARLRSGFAPLYEEQQLIDMADAIDALLRERESAKAGVTDEIFEAFDAAQTKAMGEYEMQQYHAGKESHLVNALDFATRAALEAVAPMLASARVPDNLQAAIHKVAKGYLSRRQQGYFMGEIREMLAAAPKPEKE